MFRCLTIATVCCLGVVPVSAQNLQVNDSYYYTLHGRLIEAVGEDEFSKPLPFVALELAGAIDLTCTSGDPMCVPEPEQKMLHLVLGSNEEWAAFKANLGAPVAVSGTLFHAFGGNHQTRVLLDVDLIETTPTLGIAASDGRYVSDSALCDLPADGFPSDDFVAVTMMAGSLQMQGNEFSCTGTSASADGDGFVVESDCRGEGEEYEIFFPLSTAETGNLVLNKRVLYSCASAQREFVPSQMPEQETLTVDIRPPLADLLFYGSRLGMEVTLLDITGRGTVNAQMTTENSPYNAYRFCAFYVTQPDFACIDETMALPLKSSITADCVAGTFTDFYGGRYRFAGKAATGASADFVIMDEATDRPLDDSMASGYHISLGIYRALCSASDGSRPLLSAEDYKREFDRLAAWQGQSLYERGGVASLPAMQFAMKARSDEGRMVWTKLGGTRLGMHGHFGFASNDGAAALVDFASRQIYLCLYDGRRGREVSYRFGTLLAEGLDGFGVSCPDTVDVMLEEYLPLIDERQALHLDSWDADGFGMDWRSIDRYKDLIGLGKVVYLDRCSSDLDFNPEWYAVLGSNWTNEGQFEGGILGCQISDSRYSSADDSLAFETICSTAGYTSDWNSYLLERKGERLTFDGKPVSQCAEHYFAVTEAFRSEEEMAEPVAVAATLAPGTMLDWSGGGSTLFRLGTVEASIAVELVDDVPHATLTVSRDGESLTSVQLPASHSGFGGIGVYPMGANGAQWLLFASFSGGASCCTEIIGMPIDADIAQLQRIGPFYGDRWIPEDLDGDGRYEFLLDDARFNYLYAGPPGTFRVPEIYATRNASLVDVMTEMRYRPVVQRLLVDMEAACGGEMGWSLSACVGLAATGAKLGTYDSVMRTIERRMNGARLPDNWQGKSDFAGTSEMIEAQLVEFGYVDAQP